MDPVLTPLPSDSPPVSDGGGHDELGSEEDRVGASHADVTEKSPAEKPASNQANLSFNQTQRTPSEESGSRNPESSLHYLIVGEDQQPGAFGGSVASCSVEETGFADFTLFTEQVGLPWCGGLTEQRDGGDLRVDRQVCHSGPDVITDYEPGSQHVCKTNHSAAVVQPPQDDRHSQEAQANTVVASEDGQLDSDSTDDEVEAVEISGDSDSVRNLGPPESEMDVLGCDATQETPATSRRQRAQEQRTHFTDESTVGHGETADVGELKMGTLPPSDSFADFCSAPMLADKEGQTWADFTDRSAPAEGRRQPQCCEPANKEKSEQDGVTGMNGCLGSQSCHVQQLFQSSFPEVRVPAVEGERDPPNLSVLLHSRHSPETEEETPDLGHALRIQRLMLSPPEDIHRSLGLKFKWGGSHSSTTLLRCLGVDPRSIVFIGTEKQAGTVPAYASSLGLLDPTKDPLPAAGPPGCTASSTSSGPRETQKASTCSAQDLPSTQPNWSCRGLSSSQEGTSPCRAPHP